jgi:hypothetical protein
MNPQKIECEGYTFNLGIVYERLPKFCSHIARLLVIILRFVSGCTHRKKALGRIKEEI